MLHRLIILAALLAASVAAAEPARLIASLTAGKTQTLVVYGTSLTAGGPWVAQVRAVLDQRFPKLATVVNSGQGGMASDWGLAQVQERVIAKHPDTVLIEFAANDAFLQKHISVAQARTNLDTIIARIQQALPGCEVILMIMNPPVGLPRDKRAPIGPYWQNYRDLAADRHLRLIDCSPAWQRILDRSADEYAKLVPDGIHPVAAGSTLVTTPTILAGLGIAAR